MHYYRFFCFLFLFQVSLFSSAQKQLKIKKSIATDANILRVDNFGKLYLVGKNEIKQYTPEGQPLSKNSNNFFGEISDLDASNGLELLLFFKDLSQLIFLDNQLAAKGKEFALEEIGFDQVTLACSSHGLGVWLYDQTRMELTRLDQNGKFSTKSGNLMQILGFAPNPNFMREVNNWVYMNDPKYGILVFDNFGTYYKTIPIKSLDYFQIRGNQLFYLKDQVYSSFQMKELTLDTLLTVEEKIKHILLTKNQLNALENKTLTLFEFIP